MQITNSGAIPTMEAALAYSYRRHEVILNNIANVSTPGFRGSDLPVADFQAALAKAARPEANRPPTVLGGNPGGESAERSGMRMGDLLTPVRNTDLPGPDGNNVVPEIEAAKMAKNAAMFTALSQLLARQYDLLEKAIRERI